MDVGSPDGPHYKTPISAPKVSEIKATHGWPKLSDNHCILLTTCGPTATVSFTIRIPSNNTSCFMTASLPNSERAVPTSVPPFDTSSTTLLTLSSPNPSPSWNSGLIVFALNGTLSYMIPRSAKSDANAYMAAYFHVHYRSTSHNLPSSTS